MEVTDDLDESSSSRMRCQSSIRVGSREKGEEKLETVIIDKFVKFYCKGKENT